MRGTTPPQRASRRARFAGRSSVILATLALAACSNFGNRANTYTCPSATTVPDLQTLVAVVPGPNGAAIQSSGRVNQVTVACDREGDSGVVATATVEFAGLRTTPAVNQLNLPYFVALADATGNILGKQQYTEALGFGSEGAQVTKGLDTVTIHIPLKNAQLGNVYTLVVGFQLTQAQLDYNRAHLQQ